jgi:hypothetical protein
MKSSYPARAWVIGCKELMLQALDDWVLTLFNVAAIELRQQIARLEARLKLILRNGLRTWLAQP